MDKIIFSGNLGDDPKEQTTKNGKTVVHLNVAVKHRVNGENVTEWRNVSCFGNTGKFCMDYLKKGRSVIIEGRPSPRFYKNKLEETVAVIDVFADSVEAVGSGKAGNEPSGQETQAPAIPETFTEVQTDELPF